MKSASWKHFGNVFFIVFKNFKQPSLIGGYMYQWFYSNLICGWMFVPIKHNPHPCTSSLYEIIITSAKEVMWEPLLSLLFVRYKNNSVMNGFYWKLQQMLEQGRGKYILVMFNEIKPQIWWSKYLTLDPWKNKGQTTCFLYLAGTRHNSKEPSRLVYYGPNYRRWHSPHLSILRIIRCSFRSFMLQLD